MAPAKPDLRTGLPSVSSEPDRASLSGFSGTLQEVWDETLNLYLNLSFKPNNFFFRETVSRLVLDASKVPPRTSSNHRGSGAPKFLT